MIFNTHSDLKGSHAFLGASKYHWTNYTDERFEEVFLLSLAAQRGTELHALAHELIRLKVNLPKVKKTLNMYVNDALGFRMRSEQILYFSPNAYGTADSIDFRRKTLRIHDLKTGVTPASMRQLYVYAALFYLEYILKPHEHKTVLRIYQNDEILEEEADPDLIVHIMDRIKTFDRRMNELRMEADL